MLSFITEQLQARAKAAAEAAAVEAVNEEAQMNDAVLECAHLVQELDDLSIEGTQADSTRPFTKIDIPLEDDPEITSVEMNLLDGRITNIPTDATVQESDTVYVGMRTPDDFFQEAMMETSQFMRETDEAYRNRVEDIARQKFAAYKTYCIQEGLFGFDKLSVNDSRVPARLSIDFGKMNGRDYAVKLPVKFEVDKKNRILKKQLDSVMAFHNTTNNSNLLQDAAFSAFGQKVGVENADDIWSKVTPVELVVPVKPSDKFCVAVGFELDGTGDDLQYIEWHAPIKGSKDGVKTETTTPSTGEIKKLSVMTKGEAIRQEAALIASGYHAPDRFMQEAIDFGDPNEPPAADPNAASVSFDAPPAADGMQQPAGADAPPAEGDAAAAPPEGDPAAEAPAEGTEDKEIVDTNNVSDQIAEKVADETQADAAAENDINVDGMDASDSEGDQPTEEELNAELGDAPAEGTEDTVDSAPADTSDADFDNMTMDEMLAQGQEKMKGMTMQQIKAFLQGDYTGMAEAPPPSDDAPAPEDEEGVKQEAFFLTRGNINRELDVHLRKALGILNSSELEVGEICSDFKKEGRKLNRVVHAASKMDKVYNDTERNQLLKLNHCLTDLMTMLRPDIDRNSIMTVKRMIQAFVAEASGVLKMVEAKSGRPVQEGFFDNLKKKFKKEPESLTKLCQNLLNMWEVDDSVWNAKELSEFVNEKDVLMFQEFIADQVVESIRLCSVIATKCTTEYPTDAQDFMKLKSGFEDFLAKFDFMLRTNYDRELTNTEKQTLAELHDYVDEMRATVTRFLHKINPTDTHEIEKSIQEGFFSKMWDKAKENADKKFPGAKPQQKTADKKESIPSDFPIERTLFKKILDEIKSETQTDVVVLTDFHALQNPKPDDSCAYGKPVYAPVIPKTSDGKEMRFIIQINLADVPHVIPELPSTGLLQLWLGPLERNGQQSKVLYYPDTKKPSIADQVSDKAYTADYLESPWLEESPILHRVGFKKMSESLNPSTSDEINNYEELFAKKWNEYDTTKTHTTEDVVQLVSKYPNAFPRWEYPAGTDKIGGYPAFIQSEIRDSKYNKDNSILLLQLTSDDYVAWGDAGNAYLFITKESLKKKDFSKVDFDSQCY